MPRTRFDFLELGDDGKPSPTAEEPRAAVCELRPEETIGSPGARLGEFNWPSGIAVDGYGNLYVADCANHRIQKISPKGEVFAFSAFGHDVGMLSSPADIAVDAQLCAYVVETGNCRVTKFSPMGEAILTFGHPGNGPGEFDRPCAILRDTHGTLYVADSGNGRIQTFDHRGRFLRALGRGPSSSVTAPRGIALDSASNLFVADDHHNRIIVLNPEGGQIGVIGDPGADPGQLSGPRGLLITPDSVVLVAEERNCRVQGLTFSGRPVCELTMLGKELALKAPTALTLDPTASDVYLADSGNHRVLRLRYTSGRGGAGPVGEQHR